MSHVSGGGFTGPVGLVGLERERKENRRSWFVSEGYEHEHEIDGMWGPEQ
jgi:hypothetical protein